MPIHEITENGVKYYQWGNQGKKYRTRAEAVAQAQAAYAHGYEEKSNPTGPMVHSPAPLGNVSVAPSYGKHKKVPGTVNGIGASGQYEDVPAKKLDTRRIENPSIEPKDKKPRYRD